MEDEVILERNEINVFADADVSFKTYTDSVDINSSMIETRFPFPTDKTELIKTTEGPADKSEEAKYGFELTGFNIPSIDKLELFESQISQALAPLFIQLPIGVGLVFEYECLPKGNGCMSLVCHIYYQFEHGNIVNSTQKQTLKNDLKMCLSLLCDYYAFLELSNQDTQLCKYTYGAPVNISPAYIECTIQNETIGFTQQKQASETLYLPVLTSTRGLTNTSHLKQVFMAARSANEPMKFSIKLFKEAMPKQLGYLLQKIVDDGVEVLNVDDLQKNNLNSYVESDLFKAYFNAWKQGNSDLLKLHVSVQTTSKQQDGNVLLRILGSEVFSYREINLASSNAKSCDTALDLSNIYPMGFGLPPLLPALQMLECLNFKRHFNNPTVDLPNQGLLLGHTQIAGFDQPVYMQDIDRSRHAYVIGGTGTGKSTFLYNQICQDIQNGRGVALIDPHGDLFEQVMQAVPADRKKHLEVIDPTDSSYGVGLNPLDFGQEYSVEKVNRVTNDLLDIFYKLYDMNIVGGPSFEQYFRNAVLLASVTPYKNGLHDEHAEPATLLTVIEVMRSGRYRSSLNYALEWMMDKDIGASIKSFFEMAESRTGDWSFANHALYITNKFARFTFNPVLRKLLCKPKRNIDFRKIMDERGILLVKLNKGALGNLDTQMVGMLITKYIYQAAMSRSNIKANERTPFHLYLDEFQNFLSGDVAEMLAESRKYGLYLTLAHQNFDQISQDGNNHLLNSLLGNVATQFIFRVGRKEAALLADNFYPHFNASTLTQLPDWHAMGRLLVNNKPSLPFVFHTDNPVFIETTLIQN